MEKLISDWRWSVFEHNPFGKLCLVDSKGTKLYLRPEKHYRLTGGHISVRIESREDLEDFCKLYGCKPV